MFIIRRTDQREGWVTPPGSARSYTQNCLEARRFRTREEAEAERCPENEVIENLHEIIRRTY